MSNVITSSDMSTHFWVGIRGQPFAVYKAFHGKNTLEKFHASLIIATFYGRHVLESCA